VALATGHRLGSRCEVFSGRFLLPSVFAGYVPWRFFGLGRAQFDSTSPTELLGLVCIGLGVALLAACIFEFARSDRARRSLRAAIQHHLRLRE